MQVIEETENQTIYLSYFQGNPIRFCKDKKTNEIFIKTEDVAKMLGFESEEQMMSDNEILDIVNDFWKETGEFPIKKID